MGGAFFDNAGLAEALADVVPLVNRVELRVARAEEASESGAGSLARFRFQEYISTHMSNRSRNFDLTFSGIQSRPVQKREQK